MTTDPNPADFDIAWLMERWPRDLKLSDNEFENARDWFVEKVAKLMADRILSEDDARRVALSQLSARYRIR